MKYTIIHVNDRAKAQMDKNKQILKNFEYIDSIPFFNGNTRNALDVLNDWKIRTDVWNPYDGRAFPPLPGEYGIWVSTINVWNHIIENNIDEMLVLEDDIELKEDAQETIHDLILELPADWDFLSLYSFTGQNWLDKETNIGAKYIHKSTNQASAAQAIIYSNNGAKKLRRLIQRKGIEYTTDCFIFEQSKLGFLNGYSIISNKKTVLSHEYKNIKSLIDPENIRMVEM